MNKKERMYKFIQISREIHNNKYNYSLVDYINNKTKVKIICPYHGIFEQIPTIHLRGSGCPLCSNNNIKKTKEDFIDESKKIHNNKYSYSLVNYINNKTKVKIICPEHGIFEQRPDIHLQNIGCSKCSNKYKYTTKEFIDESKKIHNNKYNYSLVDYINNKTKVKIICPGHGIFEQIAYSHLQGTGCPVCRESKGEKKIRQILNQNNIKFESQKTFNNLKYKQNLYFDFYLPDYNTCIEFDGEQHFKKFRFEKDNSKLYERQKRDQIKNEYCKNNNIHLLRIKYNEDISNKLKII